MYHWALLCGLHHGNRLANLYQQLSLRHYKTIFSNFDENVIKLYQCCVDNCLYLACIWMSKWWYFIIHHHFGKDLPDWIFYCIFLAPVKGNQVSILIIIHPQKYLQPSAAQLWMTNAPISSNVTCLCASLELSKQWNSPILPQYIAAIFKRVMIFSCMLVPQVLV